MHPTMFDLGPIPIRSYGLMMMIGFLAAIHLAARRAKKSGADDEFITNLGLISLITGIVGARVFYVFHHWSQFASTDNPFFAAINLTSGGLEFYGGFLTAIAAIIVYLQIKCRSMRWYLDILAPTIMIGLGFGRIGCFLNGCCWGAPTKMPLAIRFPYGSLPFEDQWRTNHFVEVPAELILTTSDGTPFLLDHDTLKLTDDDLKKMMATVDPKTSAGYRLALIDGHLKAFNITLADMKKMIKDLNLKTVPIQPSQIYASLTAFIIAWVLSVYYWRRKRDGMVIAWLFVLYPATRIFEEMIRADNPHDTFGLTISQAISVAAIPAAFLFMLLLRKLPERSSRAIRELSAKQAQIENIKTAKPINVS